MYTYHEQRHLLRKITVSQALPAPRSSCKVSSDAALMPLCRLQQLPSDGKSVLRASFADAVIALFLAAPFPGYVLRSHCPERSGGPCIAPEQHKPASYYRPPISSPVYQCPEASRSSENLSGQPYSSRAAFAFVCLQYCFAISVWQGSSSRMVTYAVQTLVDDTIEHRDIFQTDELLVNAFEELTRIMRVHSIESLPWLNLFCCSLERCRRLDSTWCVAENNLAVCQSQELTLCLVVHQTPAVRIDPRMLRQLARP